MSPNGFWRATRQYKAGTVDELSICGEMVTIHQGIAEKDIRALAAELFRT